MPKTRQQKEAAFKSAVEKIASAKGMVFVNYHGLTVKDVEELRAKLREENVVFQVIKKTVLQRAFKEQNLDVDVRSLSSALAVAYGLTDEVSAAKVLAAFQKNHEALAIYGGVLENKAIDQATVISLSKLPGKQELYAKIVGSINAPISGLVNTFAGTIRGFVTVLNGIKDSKA